MSWILIVNLLVTVAFSQEIASIPNTCNDLLPDMYPYMNFIEQTGDLWASENPQKAKKIYDVMAIRKLYQESTRNSINPIDDLIKKYLCDCYVKNKKISFDSNSSVIRKYFDKNIDKLIKDTKKEYKNMITKKQKDDTSLKLSESTKEKITRLKNEAIVDMDRELNRKAF